MEQSFKTKYRKNYLLSRLFSKTLQDFSKFCKRFWNHVSGRVLNWLPERLGTLAKIMIVMFPGTIKKRFSEY